MLLDQLFRNAGGGAPVRFEVFVKMLKGVAHTKYGDHDSMDKLCYFKLFRFGRKRKLAASAAEENDVLASLAPGAENQTAESDASAPLTPRSPALSIDSLRSLKSWEGGHHSLTSQSNGSGAHDHSPAGTPRDAAAGRSASLGRDAPESQTATMLDACAEPVRHEGSHSAPRVPRLNVRGQHSQSHGHGHDHSPAVTPRDIRGASLTPRTRTPRTPRVGGWQLPLSAELLDEQARLTQQQEAACDSLATDMAARRVAFAQERSRVEQATSPHPAPLRRAPYT
ncbi:hypothetical protein T484DRAFT_1743615 [Baffinella frigidus]|nr:hypothetical protein T484DRAFT_1743615 [Cryptophyta sp. CCMP2293]